MEPKRALARSPRASGNGSACRFPESSGFATFQTSAATWSWIIKSDSLPVVAVDFSPLLGRGHERLASAFQLLNLRRESIARLPLVQLWWIPAFAAPRAVAAAPDLASWFQIRMTLSEITPVPKAESTAQIEEPFRPTRSRQSLKSLQDAVGRQRKLADLDPSSYSSPLAAALNALGDRYRDTRQLKAAETSYAEALTISRRSKVHEREIGASLINLANLYRETQRKQESEHSCQEALAIRRRLAEANPEAYLPDVATTLNNLAILYRATQRMKEAEDFCAEARAILDPLWKQNPELHGNQMARINLIAADLAGSDHLTDACQFARQALVAAYDPRLKESAKELIDQFCPPPAQ